MGHVTRREAISADDIGFYGMGASPVPPFFVATAYAPRPDRQSTGNREQRTGAAVKPQRCISTNKNGPRISVLGP